MAIPLDRAAIIAEPQSVDDRQRGDPALRTAERASATRPWWSATLPRHDCAQDRCRFVAAVALAGCGSAWNDPYPAADRGKNILYSSFAERPKHLDPVQSYSSNECDFIAQIYEPPLQYHYLKRPYALIPLTAAAMPQARLPRRSGPRAARERAAAERRLQRLRDPHPARHPLPAASGLRARREPGSRLYLDLDPSARSRASYTLADFPQTGTRELIADGLRLPDQAARASARCTRRSSA